MKSNIYTKIILTVIAINLTFLTAKELNLIPTATAASSPEKPFKNGTNYGFIPVNEDGTINVRVQNKDVIDIRIKGISRNYSLGWDEIKVKQD